MVTKEKQNEKLIKFSLLTLLAAGFIYSMILPFCWGNNPFDTMGTLSILCEDRKLYFWAWIIFDGGAMVLNLYYMYNKFGRANKLIKALPIIALICGIGIAATLGHDVTSWNPKRIVHWVATGCYVAFLAASIALYAIKNIRKERVFKFMLIATLAVLAVFLVWFIVLGKSGMLEIVPHALLEILLIVFNFILK